MASIETCQVVRISLLDLAVARSTCVDAQANGKGAITRMAAYWHLPPSVVQKAIDRVEAAMGGNPFFVKGVKRTAQLTEFGELFIVQSEPFINAWGSTINVSSDS